MNLNKWMWNNRISQNTFSPHMDFFVTNMKAKLNLKQQRVKSFCSQESSFALQSNNHAKWQFCDKSKSLVLNWASDMLTPSLLLLKRWMTAEVLSKLKRWVKRLFGIASQQTHSFCCLFAGRGEWTAQLQKTANPFKLQHQSVPRGQTTA